MKHFIYLPALIILFGAISLMSCKKDNPESIVVDETPSLFFMTDPGYVSNDTMLSVHSSFIVGVIGSKNPNTNVDIESFMVTRTFDNEMSIVHWQNDMSKPGLSWQNQVYANITAGEEKWTFSIMDYSGLKKELSFIITTEGYMPPYMTFIGGQDYITQDVTLPINSTFKVGVSCSANSYTNKNISRVKVTKTFNNISTTVFEEANINEPNYLWSTTQNTSSLLGDEMWVFTVTDVEERITELSFVITTIYQPVFSANYQLVNSGGAEMLELYITCLTDDWEMTEVNVKYPGGLGNETFFGDGTIVMAGSPFTFPNYFPELGGLWRFDITGIIKSEVHMGESFTVFPSVMIPY